MLLKVCINATLSIIVGHGRGGLKDFEKFENTHVNFVWHGRLAQVSVSLWHAYIRKKRNKKTSGHGTAGIS